MLFLDFNHFVLSAQAPGTQFLTFWLTINNKGNRVNIGEPATVSVALGMADVMPELRRFTTQITLQSHFSFDYWPLLLYNTSNLTIV